MSSLLSPPALAGPPKMRAFGDALATRKNIYDNTLKAAKEIEPLADDRHTLALSDVDWADPERFTRKQRKEATLTGGTLGRRLKGTWTLTDNATGQVVDKKHQVVARVPYMTSLGTFVHRGVDYTLNHQARLKPGVYARKKNNGDLESFVNVLPGEGRAHRYALDPDKGIFKINLAQAEMPLMPLLHAMGASDKELRAAWGDKLFAANMAKNDSGVIGKLAARVLKKVEQGGDEGTTRQRVVAAFEAMKLDPEVTRRTLGHPHERVNKEAILAATKKLLAVGLGEAESDSRDDLANQTFHGPEELFAERIRKDHGGVRRGLFRKLSRAGSLQAMPSGVMTPQLEHVLTGSGLGQPLEEVSPLEVLDRQTFVTRMGEGAIGSIDAIPDEARSVTPSQQGYLDSARTPESLHAGVDTYFASGARKGADGQLYRQFQDKQGKLVYKSPRDVANAAVATPDVMKWDTKRVPVTKNGRLTYVPKNQVDYVIPSYETGFSPVANLIPFKSASKPHRVAMGSRYITQALPLVHPEAPLVQSGLPGSGGSRSYSEEYGAHAGAVRAHQAGRVESVGDGLVSIRHADGTRQDVELYQHAPMNRKTEYHQTPVVRPGDLVPAGGLLARSNFTDEHGVAAPGLNARTAWLPWLGKNHEDAVVISEGLAKRLTSSHLYQHDLEVTPKHKVGKHAFVGLFPGKFERSLLDALDDKGVVRPGQEVQFGHPLILAAREKDRAQNKIHRARQPGYADETVTWGHHDPGIVTDVAWGKSGPVVTVRSEMPMRVGDKLSGAYGDKGVVADIIPEHRMPRGEDGRPLELLLGSDVVTTRCYDEETEFMSARGWIFGRDVRDDDLLYGYNSLTAQITLQPQLLPFNKAHYEGEMLGFRSKVLNFLVTPSHRMWAKPDTGRKGTPWRELPAEKLYGKRYFVPVIGKFTPRSSSRFSLPNIVRNSVKDTAWTAATISINAGDWAEFLGWYMAEGSCTWTPGDKCEYRTHIAQSWQANPCKVAAIESLLRRLPFKWRYSKKNGQFHISSKRLTAYMRQFGGSESRFPPEWLFCQSANVIRRFIAGYWAGDGSTRGHRKGTTCQAGTTSKRLADGVQRLLLMVGTVSTVTPRGEDRRPNHKPAWFINQHKRKVRWTLPAGWYREKYNGMVYCPTVPTGYVVTRRQGRILIAGNSNPSQMVEAALGKIAAMTGQPYKAPDFEDDKDLTQWADAELKKHGLKSTETVFWPDREKKIPGVGTGMRYIMKLHHRAEDKVQGRSGGTYDAEDAPAKGGASGSKRIALLDVNALISHGAIHTLRDVKGRSTKSDRGWLQFMSGHVAPLPTESLAHEKFIALLKGAGVNVVKDGHRLHVMAMTDRDVDTLAGERELKNGETVNFDKDMKPVAGGLFDNALTGGHGGRQWAKLTLPEAYPNPVLEDPIRRVLGLTQKQLDATIAGTHTLEGYGTGPKAIASALGDVNVDRALAKAKAEFHSGRGAAKDAAARRWDVLAGAKETGVHPKDWVMSKLPVLPPIFRPVSVLGDKGVPLVSDANYLYREAVEAVNAHKSMTDLVGPENVGAERSAVYSAIKAVTGLGEPAHPKLVEKQVKGLLKSILGGGPKTSFLQRKLLSSTVDNVGRAVVVPDPEYDMDTLGIPEGQAFDIFRRFVARRLHRRGLPLREALRHVQDKTDLARSALQQEMDERPVLMNRAPVWHKFGALAFRPRLVAGDTVRVPPLVVKGLGMDFDGDAVQIHVPTTDDAVKEYYERLLPSKNLLSPADFSTPMHAPGQSYIAGLFHATKELVDKKKHERVFRRRADALAAYEKGDISVDTPVHTMED